MNTDCSQRRVIANRGRRRFAPIGARRAFGAIAAASLLATPLAAQATAALRPAPPAPVAPEVITRDAGNQATVRAIKLPRALVVDGKLDDEVYSLEKAFGGMVQVVPNYGAQMTERSDIWVTYDDTYIYVTCKCHDSAPPEEWIVNELRRDTGGLRNNDHFGVMFDTFYDRRSGFAFYTNPLGARADYSVVDEGGSNTDWNPVWTSRTGRFDGGWIVEMAIPLKSLRYRPGQNQTWGMQLRRSVRRKNEWGYLTPVPPILAGPQALNRISAAGTLVGLDLPPAGINLEVKPYMLSRVTTDRLATPVVNDKFAGDIGGDIKYQITPNLTADVTINTDFAQVEIDEQQVNLTRFALSFPEKRDFFLEGRGIFDFGRGGLGVTTTDQTDTPFLFYTRRIGLNAGRVVPIEGGGRISGKMGPWSLGVIDVQTADAVASPATNFSVLRLKRDVLKRSAIGVMATNRSVSATGSGSNQAVGVDGNFGVTQDISLGTYWAKTNTSGLKGNDQSWQGRLDYNADRYGARLEVLDVGKNFRPDVGFLRRADFQRSYGQLRFSPRPDSKLVRKYTWTAAGEYIEAGTSATPFVDTRAFTGSFVTEFHSSDQITLDFNRNYEYLSAPFTPSGSPAAIPVGAYEFNDFGASYTVGAQRRASGAVSLRVGQFYDGDIKSITIGGSAMTPSRVSINTHLSMEPTFSITQIDRAGASFTTRLARLRTDYGFTPLMFASALLQYNSADRAISSNLRFRWEYAPGSELFVVYTDERGNWDPVITPAAAQGLRNRAFVVKVNRLLRY